MKRKAYFTPPRAAARLVLAAACILLAAACTTDDDPSRTADNDNPVPLTFTAVRPAPMTDANTRAVPGKDAWKGDGTEKIKVQLIRKENMNETVVGTGIYTITDKDGTVLPDDKPIFWPDKTGEYYVRVCHPLPGEYDISDQSTPEKLTKADFLQANADCSPDGGPVALRFGHAMAKIRVELTGVAPDAGDIKVEIRLYNRITLMHVSYKPDMSGDPVYIPACRDASTTDKVAFEALGSVVGSVVKENYIRITVGNRTYFFTPEGNKDGLVSYFYLGKVYTYRITLPSTATTTTVPLSGRLIVSAPTVTPFNTTER